MSTDIFASLNPAQAEAVRHVHGPLLILAGPGSGKTRVVTHRIAYLLQQGVAPQHILALTFTNKSADEMQARVHRFTAHDRVWMGTFHRFGAFLLRRYATLVGLAENFSIYDTDDSLRALKRAIDRSAVELTHHTPEQIANRISRLKSCLSSCRDFHPRAGDPLDWLVSQIYPLYQQELMACNAVDFDDLLCHPAVLLQENPELRRRLDERFQYILVDEYQDTNLAQYAIVRALSIDYPNLAVTGDPDQSIYGWRGANLNNILEFEKDFPQARTVRLEQNYRSTQRILRAADELIAHNIHRKRKSLLSVRETGLPVRLICYPTHLDEAQHIAQQIAEDIRCGRRKGRDCAVFYRVNALSRVLEHAFREQGVPYQMVNSVEFYQRKEIKDVLAYLQLLNNPHDNVAFLRIVNTPPRGIGPRTVAMLSEAARRQGVALLEAARRSGLIEDLNQRSAVAVARFVAIHDALSIHATGAVAETIGHLLRETGYQDHLQSSQQEEDQQRLANIFELQNAAKEFDDQSPQEGGLERFLEQASLVNDTDDWSEATDRVTLMTLHSAKGLEFPMVYIMALEQGLLPHERSRGNERELEEERRLLFVGVTRAQEALQLSYAAYRPRRGVDCPTVASDFLMELPRGEMDCTDLPRSYQAAGEMKPRRPGKAAAGAAPVAPAKVMTAAEMLAAAKAPRPGAPPDVFQKGMVVTHPDYGSGLIVALSGAGLKRMATVKFFNAGQKKFCLRHSPLQPLKSTE